MRQRHLKLLYLMPSLLFTGFCTVRLLAVHIAEHLPMSSGTLLCLLLFVTVPTVGYALLFMLFPWAGRSLRR
jgi:hypothetical protein